MFSAEEYKKRLAAARDITDIDAVPLPAIREDQSYIFISYSHRDFRQVYSDLADMYEAGVRFWYDHGLTPGKDWDAEVLEMIKSPRCSGVIFYISKNLYLSPAIKREVAAVTGHDEITGEASGCAKANFSVNLFDGDPSDIIFSITPEEKREKGLNSRWLKLLMDAFSDDCTYLAFHKPSHRAELINTIRDRFNVVNDSDTVIMADGEYSGELLHGQKHGQGSFIYSTGHIYEGQWADNQRSGFGVLSHNGQTHYKGQWQNDKFCGQGVYYYSDGAVYDGQWENGLRHGQGTYIYADQGEQKRTYRGQWTEGRMEGRGVFTYADGSTYEGDFLDWKSDGYGIRKYADGRCYEGGWKNDKRHGQGRFTYADGKAWEGIFREDKMWTGQGFLYYFKGGKLTGKTYDGQLSEGNYHGEGICHFENGAVYDGQWENGLRHGQGTYIYADQGEQKRTYRGQWTEDRMEGRGIFTYADGSTYEGDFLDWNFDGYGIRKYADGRCYEGDWKNCKQHGQGRFTYADGKAWEGIFREDKMWTGQGFLYYFKDGKLTGKTYDGQLSEGNYHGEGICHFENGAVYDGQWENGLRHGQGTYIYADQGEQKRTYRGQWTEDRMEGRGIFTHADGSTYEGDFLDWNFDGYGIRKYANGYYYEGDWKNNKWHGQGRFTYADGKAWEGIFREDKMWTGQGFLYHFKGGKLTGKTYDGQLLEGSYHGEGICTHEDGTVYGGHWEQGQLHGQGYCQWHGTSDGRNSNVLYRKEGTWKRHKMIEGTVSAQLQQPDGSFRFLYWRSGKLDYNDDLLGVVQVRRNGRVKTRLIIPGTPLLWPNWWFLRATIEKAIWQFDGKSSNIPEGYGTAICYDETILEGYFQNGKPDEAQIFTVTYPTGAVYTGYIRNGLRHGQGTLRDADGAVYEGIWEADCFDTGSVTDMAFRNGRYTGQLRNGTPHGQGTHTLPDGSSHSGIWRKGRLTTAK